MTKNQNKSVSNTGIVPQHVAIVMDGNGRWAKKRMMPRAAGHKAGVGSLRNIVEVASTSGVDCLTVFAFSSENWKRPQQEVSILMDLFVSSISKYLDDLQKAGVSLRFIGDRSAFSEKLSAALLHAEESTKDNVGLKLNIAMNYGGRWDITNAAKKLLNDVRNAEVAVDDLNEDLFSEYLELADLPSVDLFIRTGGEHRISNFLLWQCAYSELYFTDVLWPDFNADEFGQALQWFSSRQRRFGRTGEQVESEHQTNKNEAVK